MTMLLCGSKGKYYFINYDGAMKTGRTSEILFSLPLEEKREQNKFTTADAQRFAAGKAITYSASISFCCMGASTEFTTLVFFTRLR
jgi:hypothetical protein